MDFGEVTVTVEGVVSPKTPILMPQATLAGLLQKHVGRDKGEVGLLLVGVDLVRTMVELVVAQGHELVVAGVHEIEGRVACRVVHQGHALVGVTAVEEQDLVALALIVLHQCRHGRHREVAGVFVCGLDLHVMAVRVVGVDDRDQRPCRFLALGADGGVGRLCARAAGREGRRGTEQAESLHEVASGDVSVHISPLPCKFLT